MSCTTPQIQALDVLAWMETAGVQVNVRMYSAVINSTLNPKP
jgi:hypothetical protein